MEKFFISQIDTKYLVILSLLFSFIGTSFAQGPGGGGCFITNIPTQEFDNQSETRTFTLPTNCSGVVATSSSNWITSNVSGNQLTISVPAYSGNQRQGNINFTLNGSTAGGVSIRQNWGDVPPPDPCIVSGFSGSSVVQAGEFKSFTLSYSSTCPSNVGYTFVEVDLNNNNESPLPGWVIPTQDAVNKTVTLQFLANEGATSRTITIRGKDQNGGEPEIGGSFTQSCQKVWYLDADGDDLRDPGSTPELDCATTKPGYTRMLTEDACPYEANTIANNTVTRWYRDTDGDEYKDSENDYVDQCNSPTPTNIWTATPKPGTDGCPNQFYATDGGCNPNCSIELSETELLFDANGGNQSITLTLPDPATCPSYEISVSNLPSGGWLSVTRNSNTLVVNCDPHADYREALSILVSVTGGTPRGFSVKQNYVPDPPDPPTCTYTTSDNISLSALGGSSTFTVGFDPDPDCKEPVEIRDAFGGPIVGLVDGWLDIDKNVYTFTLTADRNYTGYQRSVTLLVVKQSDGTPIGQGFVVTQTDCLQLWYPDTDGDTFGDYNGVPVQDCDINFLDPTINWVPNNDDVCPYEIGDVANQGCPVGKLPENWNTITTKNYDLTTTLKSSAKSYFDELGKSRQTQSWNIKTGAVWATENRYDHYGRVALSTLSAPIREGNMFEYKDDFIRKSDNSDYLLDDFDEGNLENPPKVGNETNSLGWFYSDANTRDPNLDGRVYQDITDYPFIRSIYSELNPGAALKTIGGKKVDTNGSGQVTDSDSWLQTYTFSMPATDELSLAAAFNLSEYKAFDATGNNVYKITKTISRDVRGIENVIFSDAEGKVLASARSGSEGSESSQMTLPIGAQGFIDVHIPEGITGLNLSDVAAVSIYDLITEQTITTSVNTLTNGFYRISVNDSETYDPLSPITVGYTVNYFDYSLNEYDKADRLVASYQPLNKLKTEYVYNTLGQLIKVDSPDEGISEFKYREDGQIRYSQNSEQAILNEVSFTEYDEYARPEESGVLIGVDFSTLDADGDLPTATKEEVVLTTYDLVDEDDFLPPAYPSNYKKPTYLAGNVAKTENSFSKTWYSYDIYGRVKWLVQEIVDIGYKTIDYTYDPVNGLVTFVDYQKDNTSERFVHNYIYNAANELDEVKTSVNGVNYDLQAKYFYYETGGLKRMEIGDGAQGVDYVYNLEGQLKSINHPTVFDASKDPGNDLNDLFGMQIDYHNNDYKSSLDNIQSTTYGKDQFNGNIKGIRWNNAQFKNNLPSVYSYYYDRNNWLTDAFYGSYGAQDNGNLLDHKTDNSVYTDSQGAVTIEGNLSVTLEEGFHAEIGSNVLIRVAPGEGFNPANDGDYDVTGIEYDANGNIEKLNRKRNMDGGENTMDELVYNYYQGTTSGNNDGTYNQLESINDAVTRNTNAQDIKGQNVNNYKYNLIGQLIEDYENVTAQNPNDVLRYQYNASGLVTEVTKNNVPLVKFFYNDRNHRVKKESYASGSLQQTTQYVRDVGGRVMAIYDTFGSNAPQIEHPIYGANRIGVFKRPGTNVYQLTDHLGNVRATFATNTSSAPINESFNDYYPFGMAMPGRNAVGDYRYAFQGQEKDPETGKEAFELRLWDGRIGRWLTTDPAGQYSSPYLGLGNNPIRLIDLDGAMAEDGCCGDWISKLRDWITGFGTARDQIAQSQGIDFSDEEIQLRNHERLSEGLDGAEQALRDLPYNLAPDAVGFHVGGSGGAFFGGDTNVQAILVLKGEDAGYFNLFINSGGYAADGVDTSFSLGLDFGYYTGNSVHSSVDIPGTYAGGEFGIAPGVGFSAAQTFSLDSSLNRTTWSWTSFNLAAGVKASPASGANLKGTYGATTPFFKSDRK